MGHKSFFKLKFASLLHCFAPSALDVGDYTVHGQALETVISASNLGVTLQSDLG